MRPFISKYLIYKTCHLDSPLSQAQPKFNPHKMFLYSDILDNAIQRMRYFISPESSPGTPADGNPMPLNSFPQTESFDDMDEDELPTHDRILVSVSTSVHLALQQLLETQREMNKLLHDAVKEKKLQVEHLQLLMDVPSFVSHQNYMYQQRQQGNQFQRHDDEEEDEDTPVQRDLGFVDHSPDPIDEALVQWLRKHSIKDEAIHKIIFHEYTLDDMLRQVTREELVATGMRHGSVCRIWNAILQHRHGGADS